MEREGWNEYTENELIEAARNLIPIKKDGTYRLVETGWNSRILIWNEKIAIKFPRDRGSSESLVKESAVVWILKGFPFKVPHYKIVPVDGKIVGIYAFIKGIPLSSLKDLSSSLIDDFYEYFNYTSNFDLRNFQKIDLPVSDRYEWTEKYLGTLDEFKQTLSKYVDREDVNMIQEKFSIASKNIMDNDITLIHGDFYRDNIILSHDGNRINGIIDWGESCVGDMAFDLASLSVDYPESVVIRMLPDTIRGERINHYRERMRIYRAAEPLYTISCMLKYGKTNDLKRILHKFRQNMKLLMDSGK